MVLSAIRCVYILSRLWEFVTYTFFASSVSFIRRGKFHSVQNRQGKIKNGKRFFIPSDLELCVYFHWCNGSKRNQINDQHFQYNSLFALHAAGFWCVRNCTIRSFGMLTANVVTWLNKSFNLILYKQRWIHKNKRNAI